ncbi:hypothetical protein L1987_62505 [Smallanthus sonchifolius]|uniref:Uncharacterized protein n=1 Tax=Smallanthus sonchifolius TaxID=185202 RepID=A0ACB9CAM3_9ASTR|nr:hypothetical protein L1987_62505 [Smallanthus sonchifolius]
MMILFLLQRSYKAQNQKEKKSLKRELNIHVPAAYVKLNLLKEIAEENELDWDTTASETELLKPHEDLLVCWFVSPAW